MTEADSQYPACHFWPLSRWRRGLKYVRANAGRCEVLAQRDLHSGVRMAEAVPLGLHCPRLAGIPILILGSNTALFREDELPKQPEVKGAQQTSPDITASALPEFVHSDKGDFSLSYSWKTLG